MNMPQMTPVAIHEPVSVAHDHEYHLIQHVTIVIDVDHFRAINTRYGIRAGDHVIEVLQERLQATLTVGEHVIRLGSNRFALLLLRQLDHRAAIALATRIKKQAELPVQEGQELICPVISMGVAIAAAEQQCCENGLWHAELALHTARQQAGGSLVLYTAELHRQIINTTSREHDLRQALAHQELFLVYQPIVRIADHQLIGFEALVRWRRSDGVIVNPNDFIPLAEETGLIVPLGAWVLRAACQQLQRWQRLTSKSSCLTISVNLSPRQFADPGLVPQVAQILDETGLRGYQLKLEVTETAMMASLSSALVVLEQLRALGVQIQIDDFGTGYAALSYLQHIPAHGIKLDRSFIQGFGADPRSTLIVQSIVALSEQLGLDVVVEGIETNEQATQLHASGCTFGQGFYYSKPLDDYSAGKLLQTMVVGLAENTLGQAASPAEEALVLPLPTSQLQPRRQLQRELYV